MFLLISQRIRRRPSLPNKKYTNEVLGSCQDSKKLKGLKSHHMMTMLHAWSVCGDCKQPRTWQRRYASLDISQRLVKILEASTQAHQKNAALVEHLFTSAQTFCVGWVLKGVGALCPSIGGTHRIWDVSWQHFTIQPVQPSFDHDLSICQLFVISTIWRQIEKWPEIWGSTGWITARCMFNSLTCNLTCMNATCRFHNVPSLEKIKRPNGAVQWSMKCHRDVFTWPSPWASRSIDV